MQDCETFIRGTIRFKGFSYIVAAFHDIGLTAETPVPEGVETLRQLAESVMEGADKSKAPAEAEKAIAHTMVGASDDQVDFALRFLSKIDVSHVPESERLDAVKIILKGLRFLDFFSYDDIKMNTKDKNGQRFYLHVIGEFFAEKMKLQDKDKDFVYMRHVFTMEKDGKRWTKTSTMQGVGASKADNGFSFCAQTVGYTTAYAAQLILDGKIERRGVLSPIYKEIYEPVLKALKDNHDIECIEEDGKMPERAEIGRAHV